MLSFGFRSNRVFFIKTASPVSPLYEGYLLLLLLPLLQRIAGGLGPWNQPVVNKYTITSQGETYITFIRAVLRRAVCVCWGRGGEGERMALPEELLFLVGFQQAWSPYHPYSPRCPVDFTTQTRVRGSIFRRSIVTKGDRIISSSFLSLIFGYKKSIENTFSTNAFRRSKQWIWISGFRPIRTRNKKQTRG